MDARTFQEAIRSATVTYPIPFIFAILLLVTILCAGGVLLSTGWRSVFLATVGAFCAVAAVALVACAFAFRPELLRSEQHVLRMTMASIIGDRDMPPDARERVSHAVLEAGGPLRPKWSGQDAERHGTDGGGTNA
jgi:hypothetical protein